MSDLGFHPRFFDIFFADHFNSQNKTRSQIPSHVHVSEPSLSQFSSHFELGQRKLFSFSGRQHRAEIEERLICILSEVFSTLLLRCVQFLIGVVSLCYFHVPILILFLFRVSGFGLVRVDHGWIGAAYSFLFHIFDIDCSFLLILTHNSFNLSSADSSIILQSALRLRLVQSFDAFIGILTGK